MLTKHNIVALLAFSFTVNATVAEFSIGAGAVYNESPYHGYNDNVHAAPFVSHENESLCFGQTTLGYILSRSESNEFSIIASYMSLEFDPSDNDDHAMKTLDKHGVTAMAGAAWYHRKRWGNVRASATADVLDNSDGWVGEVSLFRPMPIGKLTLMPSIGVLYYDEKFSEYYYGISGSGFRRSGLSSYSPDDSWIPYTGLSAKYALATDLTLLVSANCNALPGDTKDSPMVDRDDNFTFMSGLARRF